MCSKLAELTSPVGLNCQLELQKADKGRARAISPKLVYFCWTPYLITYQFRDNHYQMAIWHKPFSNNHIAVHSKFPKPRQSNASAYEEKWQSRIKCSQPHRTKGFASCPLVGIFNKPSRTHLSRKHSGSCICMKIAEVSYSLLTGKCLPFHAHWQKCKGTSQKQEQKAPSKIGRQTMILVTYLLRTLVCQLKHLLKFPTSNKQCPTNNPLHPTPQQGMGEEGDAMESEQ